MGWGDDASAFLARVLPWPATLEDIGYGNIHWTTTAADSGRTIWVGRPYRTVPEAVGMVQWLLARDGVKDIYFCTSIQRNTKTNNKGKLAAERSAANAYRVKALWVDIDVKPGKGYSSAEEALEALVDFYRAVNLPKPSMIVHSGGGLHVYWVLREAIATAEWQPLANMLKDALIHHGVKCDTQCTVDVARVLRVPETWNCKEEIRRPVHLLWKDGPDHDYSALDGALRTFLSTRQPVAGGGLSVEDQYATARHSRPPAMALDRTLFPVRALPAIYAECLDTDAYAIEPEEVHLDILAITQGCGFIADAIRTGGKEYTQPLWNLTTLCSTFFGDKGNRFAHAMAAEHPGYTHESTEALWDRKQRERKEKGLGWPKCASIQAAGCAACATCPAFQLKKTPLHLGLQSAPSATFTSTPSTVSTYSAALSSGPAINSAIINAQKAALYLPKGHTLNQQGRICRIVTTKSKGGMPPITDLIPLFDCDLFEPFAELEPRAINFITTVGRNPTSEVKITAEEGYGMSLKSRLAEQGVTINPDATLEWVRAFIMAWLSELENNRISQRTRSWGWLPNQVGFAFGGRVYFTDGTDMPSGCCDLALKARYTPTGDTAKWFELCKLVTDQKNPAYDVLLLASFAAPLTVFTGGTGGLLSVYGESGVGKSKTTHLGLAVWGQPGTTKVGMGTSNTALTILLGKIGNLPLYWDEIRGKEAQLTVIDAAFYIHEGAGKQRGGRDGRSLKSVDTWSTTLTACSNSPLYDLIPATSRTNSAGMMRIFEYRLDLIPGALGIDENDYNRKIAKLDDNHSGVGLQYVKLLVSRKDEIEQLVGDTIKTFSAAVNARTSERIWVQFCSTIIVAAQLANDLGCEFNVNAIKEFLMEKYQALRATVATEEVGGEESAENTLTEFLKCHKRNEIATDKLPGKGKPTQISVLTGLLPSTEGGVVIQWVRDSAQLIISDSKFKQWLAKNEISRKITYDGLIKRFNMSTNHKRSMGAGTPYASNREMVCEIPIAPGTPLFDALLSACMTSQSTMVALQQVV